ncbi:hypothetical protein C1645_827963 [Glomus cerebriforme]|uniref:Helicase ATP-binding domain-containing protein n=1 Tax=Glomus cerebriforme TaxID=658196 RepID=A0A397SRQ1_9GLOM|nr:hypothetical protein C1645_827963 [Glomus cerebriforme]
MSTSHYLSILLSLPCPNCLDIICLLCKTSTQYSNEDLGAKFSYLVAGAILAGEMNRNSFQTALATIGITNQCSKQSYHNYQNCMYKPIIKDAKLSSRIILLEILDNLENIYLPGQEKILSIGFDYSWSHFRNAYQANNEFLYLGDLSGYNYKPVIAFYTIENSRSIQINNSSRIVHKGNFNGTLRQMEHAILLALLNDIMPILEKTDFTIHICVDVKGLIQHLLDDHSICWSNICWMKDNLELHLQELTLKNYTQTDIDKFRNVITTIFRVPFGQGLVTTLHTSHNETFNRKILKYLDKRIDYWASYSARHALAVIDQNDGLDELVSYKKAIIAYLNDNDTFVSMKTGGGKTLYYALLAICSEGLTIRELIKAGISCATLYANLIQGARVQEKDFRKAWTQLGILKQRWKLAPIMLLTVTCTRSEVNEILRNLTIEKKNLTLIHDSISYRSEIIFNVQE